MGHVWPNLAFGLEKVGKKDEEKRGQRGIGILFPKLFWPTVRKIYSTDREKLLKREAEGQEFAKLLRSLDRTIYSNSETETERFFNLFLNISQA